MRCLIVFSILMNLNLAFGQVAKDTSFTVSSEYKKQLKKYPHIKMVKPQSNSLVLKQKDIVYTDENRPLYLDAYLFKSNIKLPAVVMLHGGGWKSGDKSMLESFAEKIASNGYQCFAVEYRLSDEAQYPAGIEDVLKAIAYIKKNAERFNVDASKIAILGQSSGAQMASLIGTKYNTEVNAIINIDGVLAFHHPESTEGKYASLWLGGTYEEIPEIWKDASALFHTNEKTPPILFINSQHDRFHAGRNDMIEILNKHKIYSRVETISDSPHTFWLFEPWFDKTVQYTLDFLNEKLKS
ncbi:acetyl esterase/lipase [Flavobacterium arsenatis]|uniref:Acetyl esterase/lipase n=1 Tax=Flavobacterium arsenatis TaxID=1484332 RepID=A0ABU1TUS3_9FLAO|nr:alpha/beta hydrolase [Flavobacterium arsenatis]MDR6969634.1 acetyl esterase/lipase [Flavobacterium arsenatis]